MENPHLEAQTAVLTRIVSNVEKLNEAMMELNRALGEINDHNANIVRVTDLWSHYNRNVVFNLTAQGAMEDPR